MITFNYLMAQALLILNAKLKKENTAKRVGGLFRDLLNYIQNAILGMILKGEKENEAAIKAISNPTKGDTYKAIDTGHYWCYDGSKWNDIGEIIPSNAATKKERAAGDLISSGFFATGSVFTNIASEAILNIEAVSDWSGQYTGKLYLWYLNNGNGVDKRPTIYINKADANGNIIIGTPGIISQYLPNPDSFNQKLGIEVMDVKEVNFSGVNLKITIDWDKVEPKNVIQTSLDSILNTAHLLQKYNKSEKDIVLRSDTSGVTNDETFFVNKVGDYSDSLEIFRAENLTWNDGQAYQAGGLINNAAMSHSTPVAVTPGSTIGIPLVPSAAFIHVFLDASNNIVQSFGNNGTTWQITELVQQQVPANAVSVSFSWGAAAQYKQTFYAKLPKTDQSPVRTWDDLIWFNNLSWQSTSKQPVATAGMSISERTKTASAWLDTTTVPSSMIGVACFDGNLKLLGVIVSTTAAWGDIKKVRLYHDTAYVSYSFADKYKNKFSTQETSGTDFTITEEGLYLVHAKDRAFTINKLSSETLAQAKQYTDDKISGIEVGGYDYTINKPVLPPQLFLRSDKDVFLYRKSLLSSITNSSPFGVFITSSTGNRKVVDIQEPTGLDINSLNGAAKFVVQQSNALTKLVYKDLQIFKKDVSTLNGKTISVMSLGDSLTEGMDWKSTPVTMLSDALKSVGITTRFIGTLARNFTNRQGQTVKINYEGRGGWRYRTLVGLESKFAGLNQIIPASQTKSEWMLGVDGATMNEIKANNTFLYPATAQDLANYPEWCFNFIPGNTYYNHSYAQDGTPGTYYIFDPARYFQLRNVEIPDVLVMAFGTNEWYLNAYGGFDAVKATSCFEFIVTRFRQAAPNMKIVVIPAQTLMLGRDETWRTQYSILCSNIMRAAELKIAAGDSKLFVCPIYAQGSRILAFDNPIGAATNISAYNSTKEVAVSQDVHYMYNLDDESNNDYTEALAACVVNVIE